MKKIHTAVSFWRSFSVAIVFWTALGLFQGRVLFVNDRDHANYPSYAHYFVWAGIDAFNWAMITPFVFLFARRLPFQRQHWLLRTLQYAVLGPIVAFYFVFISVSAGKVLPLSDDVGDLLLGEPIAFDHRRIVSRIQPGSLSEILPAPEA
jgi:hypothetical protein